jgi:beta-xylosidase
MPHTSSRKKRNTINSNKRAEVVDDEGWTRVTTKAQSNSGATSHVVSGRYYNPSNPSLKEPTESVPGPTEPLQAPPDATVEAVKVAYEKLRKMWLASDSYKDLHAAIDAHLNPARKLQHCLLFGSGSFCGMREGWIGRHDVALIQTAIFNSTVDIIGKPRAEELQVSGS